MHFIGYGLYPHNWIIDFSHPCCHRVLGCSSLYLLISQPGNWAKSKTIEGMTRIHLKLGCIDRNGGQTLRFLVLALPNVAAHTLFFLLLPLAEIMPAPRMTGPRLTRPFEVHRLSAN